MRPFIQQMSSVQAAFGGAAPDTVVGGGFRNYQVPSATESYFKSLNGSQAAITTDVRYVVGGTGLGAPLDNHTTSYFVLFWGTLNVDFVGGDTGHFGHVCVREGLNSSTTDAAGTDATPDSISIATESQLLQETESWYSPNRPAAATNSEWGVQLNLDDISRLYLNGATLLIFPQDDATFTGSTLGVLNSTWDTVSLTAIVCNNQVGGDEDQVTSGTITVGRTSRYLIGTYVRVSQSAASNSSAAVRYHWQIDGVDHWNVRTNTVGSTLTGRGIHIGSDGNVTAAARHEYSQFAISQLTAGNHTVSLTGNRHEAADGNENIGIIRLFAIDTDMFSQAIYSELSTAQSASNTVSFQNAEINPITITVDGTAKVLLIFSTSVHTNRSSLPRFRITRNGTAITPNGTDGGSNTYPTVRSYQAQYAAVSLTASPDNLTIPFSLVWVDEPAAGTYVYRVQVISNSEVNPALWNTRDDGTSGYKGLFAAIELKLATSGY